MNLISLAQLADYFDRIGKYDFADKIDTLIEQRRNLNKVLKVCNQLRQAGCNIKMKKEQDLVKFAYFLRQNNAPALANMTESVYASLVQEENQYGFCPQVRKNKENAADDMPAVKLERILTTRYCPDHIGVQAFRVNENIYQCPLDGKVYNFNSGFTNYKGQRVPGGSVSEQTPQTANYGGVPQAVYNPRSNVISQY